MLVPLHVPNLMFPDTMYTPIPWTMKGAKNPLCDQSFFTALPNNTQICYLIKNFNNDDIGGPVPYTLFSDTADIGFYSTCFLRNPEFRYNIPVTPLKAQLDPFLYANGKCIPCEDRKIAAGSMLPDWKVATSCRDCDLDPAPSQRNTTIARRSWAPVFVGYKLSTTLTKPLYPPGSFKATSNECSYLVHNDPACSPLVAFMDFTASVTGVTYSTNATYIASVANCLCLLSANVPSSIQSATSTSLSTYNVTKVQASLNATSLIAADRMWKINILLPQP